MNHPIMLLDRDNKIKLELLREKNKFELKNCFNLYIIKKLIKLFQLHCSRKKVDEKSNKENLKLDENSLLNKSANPESLKK